MPRQIARHEIVEMLTIEDALFARAAREPFLAGPKLLTQMMAQRTFQLHHDACWFHELQPAQHDVEMRLFIAGRV